MPRSYSHGSWTVSEPRRLTWVDVDGASLGIFIDPPYPDYPPVGEDSRRLLQLGSIQKVITDESLGFEFDSPDDAIAHVTSIVGGTAPRPAQIVIDGVAEPLELVRVGVWVFATTAYPSEHHLLLVMPASRVSIPGLVSTTSRGTTPM